MQSNDVIVPSPRQDREFDKVCWEDSKEWWIDVGCVEMMSEDGFVLRKVGTLGVVGVCCVD